jgi:hypothetical protein
MSLPAQIKGVQSLLCCLVGLVFTVSDVSLAQSLCCLVGSSYLHIAEVKLKAVALLDPAAAARPPCVMHNAQLYFSSQSKLSAAQTGSTTL